MKKSITRKISNCLVCKNRNLKKIYIFKNINLLSPNLSEKLRIKEKYINFSINFCPKCLNIQLSNYINPDLMYENFSYQTAISKELIVHNQEYAKKINTKLKLYKSKILDIGSNDGSLLKKFKKNNFRLGVEPSKEVSKIANKNNIQTLNNFFNYNFSKKIKKNFGQFDVIFCNNTLANISDINDFVKGLKNLLNKDGSIIIETSYSINVMKKYLLDTIYHEHINYFNLNSLKFLMESLDLKIYDVEKIVTKGGSLRIYVAKKTNKIKVKSKKLLKILNEEKVFYKQKKFIKKFNDNIRFRKNKIAKILQSKKINKIYGFGSSVGCFTIANEFELFKYIDYFIDDFPLRKHLTFNNGQILIKKTKYVNPKSNDLIIGLAWRYFKKYLSNNKKFNKLKKLYLYPNIKFI